MYEPNSAKDRHGGTVQFIRDSPDLQQSSEPQDLVDGQLYSACGVTLMMLGTCQGEAQLSMRAVFR